MKEGGKILNQQFIPNQQFQNIQPIKIFYMAQQFTTTSTLLNPYITHTLNNMDLVKTMNNE